MNLDDKYNFTPTISNSILERVSVKQALAMICDGNNVVLKTKDMNDRDCVVEILADKGSIKFGTWDDEHVSAKGLLSGEYCFHRAPVVITSGIVDDITDYSSFRYIFKRVSNLVDNIKDCEIYAYSETFELETDITELVEQSSIGEDIFRCDKETGEYVKVDFGKVTIGELVIERFYLKTITCDKFNCKDILSKRPLDVLGPNVKQRYVFTLVETQETRNINGVRWPVG